MRDYELVEPQRYYREHRAARVHEHIFPCKRVSGFACAEGHEERFERGENNARDYDGKYRKHQKRVGEDFFCVVGSAFAQTDCENGTSSEAYEKGKRGNKRGDGCANSDACKSKVTDAFYVAYENSVNDRIKHVDELCYHGGYGKSDYRSEYFFFAEIEGFHCLCFLPFRFAFPLNSRYIIATGNI